MIKTINNIKFTPFGGIYLIHQQILDKNIPQVINTTPWEIALPIPSIVIQT
jgi:hypothetical protein